MSQAELRRYFEVAQADVRASVARKLIEGVRGPWAGPTLVEALQGLRRSLEVLR